MKIAVIGAGSSGLVTLKYLRDAYPASDIVCFEQSQSVRGCWGKQRPDFISTSTKYTTQFSCFRKYQASVSPQHDFSEFYRGSEFGDYLESFVEHFNLKQCVRFGVRVQKIERVQNKWHVSLLGNEECQTFDAVFVCTGLVNQKVALESTHIPIADDPETLRNKTVVIVGGGESATDIANYLAKPEHNNKVFLSLRSGVRVSPRYHPIRGVPSDFLRNRLLMSFSKTLRNWVGEHFVSFRIRFQDTLSKMFPAKHTQTPSVQALRKEWDWKLKVRAKDDLFNMFHNKSDEFLNAVAEKRLSIIGPPTDNTWQEFFDFDQQAKQRLSPDVLVPSTGYQSRVPDLFLERVELKDFYHGCVHIALPNLFLIGFARPIIGNIPSMAEMQARYTVGLLAGKYKLPIDVQSKQRKVWEELTSDYGKLNTKNVYPAEHIPYTDALAKEMNIMSSLAKLPFKTWLKVMTVPSSTFHYVDEYFDVRELEEQKVYMPGVLIGLMFVFYALMSPWYFLKDSLKD
ncbi:MAG: FAD/NAD(P)-binding protein [Trueperaceae bacterium]